MLRNEHMETQQKNIARFNKRWLELKGKIKSNTSKSQIIRAMLVITKQIVKTETIYRFGKVLGQ